MVKQLGVPTFFITLSSADSKLRELVSVINKVHKLDILEKYVENLGFHDRCYFLNSNPVVVARYFLNVLLMIHWGSLNIMLLVLNLKFLVHCFRWVVNAPVLTSRNKEEYAAFVDQTVHAFLPERNENPDLHGLVKLYQLQKHLQTCRKYKNEVCRFKLGKFFQKMH